MKNKEVKATLTDADMVKLLEELCPFVQHEKRKALVSVEDKKVSSRPRLRR